jgi:hypothetical protein
MVSMGVGEQKILEAVRIQAIALNVLDDRLNRHAGAAINQRHLSAPIDQINMAIEFVGNSKAQSPAANQVDSLAQAHPLIPVVNFDILLLVS